jgi:hypothetical protein
LLSIFLPAPILARLPRVDRRWTVHFGGVAMWCYRPGVVWWFHRMRSSQQHWTVCSRNSLMMSTVAVESIVSLRADLETVERFRHSFSRIPLASTSCLGSVFHVKPSWLCPSTVRTAAHSWPYIRGGSGSGSGGGGGGGGDEDQAQNKPGLHLRLTQRWCSGRPRLQRRGYSPTTMFHVKREFYVDLENRRSKSGPNCPIPAPPRARCRTPAFPQRPANEDTARI